jgi:hypothetical protein
VYGLGEQFGPLNKRGQIVYSQVDDALGVNTGLTYKGAPFCWGVGSGKGAWGVFVNTPGRVVHGVGHPEWSHRSYSVIVDDEALDIFVMTAREPAQILDLYTQLTGRAAAVPLWGLGLWVSKAYYRTAEEAIAVAGKLRARRIPCDVLTLDGRAAWDALRFSLGPAALSAAGRGARSHESQRPAYLRLGISLRVNSLAIVPRTRQQELPAQDRDRRPVYLRLGHHSRHLALRRRAYAVAAVGDRRLHQPGCVRVVA